MDLNKENLNFILSKTILKLRRTQKITKEQFFLLKNDLKKKNSILKRKIFFLEEQNNFQKMVEDNLEEIFLRIRLRNSIFENFCKKSSSKKEKRESSPISKILLRKKILNEIKEKKNENLRFKILLKEI